MAASSFEQYLEGIDYIRHKYNFKRQVWEIDTDKHRDFSTMNNLCYLYKKDNCPDFRYGLHEKDKPPTLISPRPKKAIKDNSKTIILTLDDNEMNRLLVGNTPKELYNKLITELEQFKVETNNK